MRVNGYAFIKIYIKTLRRIANKMFISKYIYIYSHIRFQRIICARVYPFLLSLWNYFRSYEIFFKLPFFFKLQLLYQEIASHLSVNDRCGKETYRIFPQSLLIRGHKVRSRQIYGTMGEGEGCYVIFHFLQKPASENIRAKNTARRREQKFVILWEIVVEQM